jgi:putative transposase
MKPSPRCKDTVLGCLGRALAVCEGIELHAFVFLSNHFHLLLTVKDGRSLAKFMNHVDSNVARKLARLTGWSGAFWSRRYRSIEAIDPAAVEERLAYILGQGVKEGLVASPHDWPGATSLRANLYGKTLRGTWFNQTEHWWAARRGEDTSRERFETTYEVPIHPLPGWRHLSESDRRGKVRAIVRDIEASAPSRVLGVAAILREDPHEIHRDAARSKAPPCHSSTLDGWQAHRDMLRGETEHYVVAASRLRQGDLSALTSLPRFHFPPRLPFGLTPG